MSSVEQCFPNLGNPKMNQRDCETLPATWTLLLFCFFLVPHLQAKNKQPVFTDCDDGL